MDPRLIIVEGPDCVGKTTFVRNLANAIRKQRIRVCVTLRTTCSKALLPGMLDYQTALFKDVSECVAAGYLVIMDRSWPSEEVYRPIMRPKAENYSSRIKLLAEQYQPTYLFLERDDILAAHKESKDRAHPYTQRQFAKIVKGYRALAEEVYGDFFFRERTHILNFKEFSPGVDYLLPRLFKQGGYSQDIPLLNVVGSEKLGGVVPSTADEDRELEAKLKAADQREARAFRAGTGGMSWEQGVDQPPAGIEEV